MNELTSAERDVLTTDAARFLTSLGLGETFCFERLSGGRNNRVYRVSGEQADVILKWYFHSAADSRNRLDCEFAFYEYAAAADADGIAKPLGRDGQLQMAVYSWLDGRRLRPAETESGHVDQAIRFARMLNQRRDERCAKELPIASEACFTLQEHIECVAARVARLQSILASSELHEEAKRFANAVVAPALDEAVAKLQSWARRTRIDLRALLPATSRCISPSDFGFHNALIGDNGLLWFHDFEYAGWDDPAKMLCDFYCQPDLPAPRETWRAFADLAAALADDTAQERQRQAILFPLYQVKWCCILLNEFTVEDHRRRTFADSQSMDLAGQLEKAARLGAQLTEELQT